MRQMVFHYNGAQKLLTLYFRQLLLLRENFRKHNSICILAVAHMIHPKEVYVPGNLG